MSRSRPNDKTPNPSTCWFEWKSTDKCFAYWDKEKEELVKVKLPFTFIVLDRTATIRGYNKKLKVGIFSNEVKDTREQPFVVKFFSGAEIARGFWADIKDTVAAKQGTFGLNIYIAFKDGDGPLQLGAIQATGCCRSAWIEFEKAKGNRKKIDTMAVTVRSVYEDKTGTVDFNAPVFEFKEISDETNKQALVLDKELQEYFDSYFSRPVATRVEQTDDDQSSPPDEPQDDHDHSIDMDDDVPF